MQEMNDDFKVIKGIIRVIKDRRRTDKEKRILVIDILRCYGLYEVGYVGDRTITLENLYKPKENKQTPKGKHQDMEGVLVPIQLFSCKVLNAKVQFQAILN